MGKLSWDEVGKHVYENGVNHGVLYVQDWNEQQKKMVYGNGVAWNGLTAVTESPDGAEPNDLWADNIKYATLRSAETFGGTIEAYTYPEEFAECDGSVNIDGVYIGQQKRKGFGFCYRTEVGNDTPTGSDDGYKLHIWYGCTASPSEKSYETINDSPDAITFSWEVDTVPVPLSVTDSNDVTTDYLPVSTITIDSRTVGKAKMALIEAKLYGTDDTQPQLPDPATVINTLKN